MDLSQHRSADLGDFLMLSKAMKEGVLEKATPWIIYKPISPDKAIESNLCAIFGVFFILDITAWH